MDELLCAPGWVTHEAEVSGASWESVRVERTILVSAAGLVTSEVTISGIPGKTVRVGTAELTSSPEPVAVGGVLSDSLWETFRVSLETVELVSAR